MESKVKAPAIAMLVAGIAGLGLCLMDLVWTAVGASMHTSQMDIRDLPPEVRRLAEAFSHPALTLGWTGMSLVAFAFVTFAGVRMLQMRSWPLALAGSIALLLPCFTPCCCSCGLTLAVGVWSLIVLLDPQVKQAFKP